MVDVGLGGLSRCWFTIGLVWVASWYLPLHGLDVETAAQYSFRPRCACGVRGDKSLLRAGKIFPILHQCFPVLWF